ncbi:hypothetical protein DAMA08_040030 [Martiniozyma asiatica (nom. inval.)]|nr:hypothetical protein DAMA08_040030 [Martiniozyma asiatica]
MTTRRSSNLSSSNSKNSHSLHQPTNPKILATRARQYGQDYSTKTFIKSAPSLIQNAKAYESQPGHESKEEAYILYARFVDILVNHVSKKNDLIESKNAYKQNPNSKNGELYKDFLKQLKKLPDVMDKSEILHAELKAEYDEWIKIEDKRKELRELQKRKLKERQESLLLEEKFHKEMIRRKSSATSDNELGQKLRSLSAGSGGLWGSQTIAETLKYPSIGDFAIEEDDENIQHISPSLPPLPSNETVELNSKLPDDKKIISKLTESFNNSSINSDINHKTVNYTEGGAPMRTIFLPSELKSNFLSIATPNTVKNLETCGILCGKLNRNAFFVTHLLIPEQESTVDTCSTKNEEKMFDYIDNEDPDLFILGWIHTHPTQSCFLSSVDLHTQNSYQIMLNEAIALVCSPDDKFPKQFGIFRLTDPPGVPTITSCTNSGFHPHDEKDLYVECNRLKGDPTSGHVVIREGLPFKVKDLRY